MSRRRTAAAVTAGVALGGGALGAALVGGDGGDATADSSRSTATASIERRDLVERETVDGTLGYSDARQVTNRMPGAITWTPKAGSVVKINRRLYEVDGRKVYLLDGSYPAYRPLTPGVGGRDVRQLERNLRSLGFDKGRAMRVDGTWDFATTIAVRRWQRSKGLPETGWIEAGQVVFQPGRRRISAVSEAQPPADQAAAGSSQCAPALMTTTSTRRIVTIDLKTTQYSLAETGATVRVELPNGKTVGGTITSVGKTAAKKPATMDDDDPEATVEVEVRLRRNSRVDLDQAPVDVALEKKRARDALAIPVTALLARQGGRYAVEVRTGGTRRIVPVDTGLYTDGYVQITGRGLRPGMRVSDARV
jgi:peptidoglycan hydrolase-like protein with peptidoglycan-binding domain